MWGAIAMAAVSVASSIKKSNDQNAQLEAIQNENERQNTQTWKAMGERINTVNLQRGLLRQQTGTDLLSIREAAGKAASTSINNAAAAGIEGVSVNEAVDDINRQSQTAQAQTTYKEQVQEMNLDTQVQDIIDSAVANQRYSQTTQSTGSIISNALFAGGTTFASAYAGGAFSYGGSAASASSASSGLNLGSTSLTTNYLAQSSASSFENSYTPYGY